MDTGLVLVPNTLSLDCEAQHRCRVGSSEQLIQLLNDEGIRAEDLLVLGAGSNVVLPPRLAKTWLSISNSSITILSETQETVVIRVGAGKNWHELVLETLDQGWYGLENLALIPGLVGASPIQNIGAYGRELSEFVVAVNGVDLDSRQESQLSAEECQFAYRDSVFKQELRDRFVVTSVDLQLSRTDNCVVSYPSLQPHFDGANAQPTALEVCKTVVAVRLERLPNPEVTPNAGSFFKNPILNSTQANDLKTKHEALPLFTQPDGRQKSSAAWLIEHAGLRGLSVGGAAVSMQHSLVLVNQGRATQADVLTLAQQIQLKVGKAFDVELEIEPRVYAGE